MSSAVQAQASEFGARENFSVSAANLELLRLVDQVLNNCVGLASASMHDNDSLVLAARMESDEGFAGFVAEDYLLDPARSSESSLSSSSRSTTVPELSGESGTLLMICTTAGPCTVFPASESMRARSL